MAGVMQPQKRQNMLSEALPVAGQVIGTAFGGPVGGMAGGKLGSAVADSRSDNTAPPIDSKAPGAIGRRIDMITAQPPDPSKDLAAAEAATATLPPDLKKQYQPILARARVLAEQGRGPA